MGKESDLSQRELVCEMIFWLPGQPYLMIIHLIFTKEPVLASSGNKLEHCLHSHQVYDRSNSQTKKCGSFSQVTSIMVRWKQGRWGPWLSSPPLPYFILTLVFYRLSPVLPRKIRALQRDRAKDLKLYLKELLSDWLRKF